MAGTICPSVPVARAGTEVDEEAEVLKERRVVVRGVRSRSIIDNRSEWSKVNLQLIANLMIGRLDS